MIFGAAHPASVPVLTYGQVIRKIQKNKISRITLQPGSTVGGYETKDGEVGKTSVIANDTFIKTAIEHDVDLIISSPEDKPATTGELFSMFVMGVLLLSIVSSVVRSQGGGIGSQNPFKSATFETIHDTGVTFDDVAGIDSAKEEIVEIVDFLKNPSKFKNAGATVPRGCLLTGSPGTGKTLLAKAIAGEAGVPFVATSASQFVELFVGMGASRIRSLFKQARENKPAIIFIDEIDTIGKSRSNSIATSGGTDEREQTLNQLLLEMDGFKENDGIIVVAATNRAEIIDEALLRPGRFDRKITVELPSREGRKKILEVHSKNKNLGCSVDLEVVASATLGSSGADLKNIMNEAAIMAARDGRDTIEMWDVDESIDKVTIGLKQDKSISPKMRKVIAYHEAGHALISALVDGPESVRKITIVPRGKTGGVTMFMPPVDSQDTSLYTKSFLKKRIMIGLGGTVAEEIVFGEDEITTGAAGDIQHITDIADSMVSEFGFSTQKGKMRIDGDVEYEIKYIIDECYKIVKSYMKTYRDRLDMIASELLEKEVIESVDFVNIFTRPSQAVN